MEVKAESYTWRLTCYIKVSLPEGTSFISLHLHPVCWTSPLAEYRWITWNCKKNRNISNQFIKPFLPVGVVFFKPSLLSYFSLPLLAPVLSLFLSFSSPIFCIDGYAMLLNFQCVFFAFLHKQQKHLSMQLNIKRPLTVSQKVKIKRFPLLLVLLYTAALLQILTTGT